MSLEPVMQRLEENNMTINLSKYFFRQHWGQLCGFSHLQALVQAKIRWKAVKTAKISQTKEEIKSFVRL
jgi:hypothetical protein